MSRGIILLLEDSRGVHIPRDFVMDLIIVDKQTVEGIDEEQIEILKQGHEHELYWEVWQEVLDNFNTHVTGTVWTLHQDGDLFLICQELMTDKEKQEFFGLGYEEEL